MPESGPAINLSTLWVPVLPETSGLTAKLKEAGTQGRRAFEEGFGTSNPEALGTSFASKFSNAFTNKLKGAELGLGFSGAIDKLTEQVDGKLAASLKTKLPGLLKDLQAQHDAVTAAEERHAKATMQLTTAQQAGYIPHNAMVQLLKEERYSQTDATAAREKAAASQQKFNSVLGDYQAASAKAFGSTEMFAGMLGGAMVFGIQAVVQGMEDMIELGAKVFEGAIESAEKLSEDLVEVGEKYAHLNIQVSEFSSASGEALGGLQASAAKVFTGLDVAGEDTGRTLATLYSRLGLTGSALEQLTTHVERLEGRFRDLRPEALATAFAALGVNGKDADNVLASWVQSAQSAGESTGQLITQLSQLGDTLRPEVTGLTPEQLGHWISQINEKVPDAQKVITGLAHAEQDFAKHNLSFADGLKTAAAQIKSAATEADKENLAEHLFGTRNWSGALDAIQMFTASSSDAFHANGSDLDDLLEKWSDLGNKIDEFKHHVEGAFAPLGKGAVDAVEHGLASVSKWFDTHHDKIVTDIEKWGDAFIDLLPEIKDFASTAVTLLGPLVDALKPVAALAMEIAGAFEIATGHFSSGWNLLKDSQDVIEHDYSKDFKGFADQIDGVKIDTDKIKDNFNGMLESAKDMPDWVGSGIMPQQLMPSNLPPSAPYNPAAPEPHWATGQSAPPLTVPPPPPGAPKGMPGNPLSPTQPGTQTAPSNLPPFAQQDTPSGYSSSDGVDWRDIAQAESSGNYRIDHGEGDDVTGAFQIATATWLSHGGGAFAPKAYMASPDQQLIVAQRVLADQGPTAWPQTFKNHPEWFGSYAGKHASTGGQSSGGGDMSKMLSAFNFGPKGKDTILSYYTPGEYVWDAETVDKYGPLIKALHGGGRYFGGGGDGAAAYAASGAGNDRPDLIDPQLQAVMAIANQGFGLTLTAGKSGHGTHDVDGGWHDSGQAGDFGNGRDTPEETAFAQYMFEHFGSELSELIYAGPGMPKLIKDGKVVDPMFYGADTLAGHHDHVHVAVRETQTLSDQMSPGSEPLAMGSPSSGGGFSPSSSGFQLTGWGGSGGSGGFPGGSGGGMPSDPSQMTPQQFSVYEEQRSRQKAVRDKGDDVDRLQAEKKKLEDTDIPQAKKALDDETKLGVAGDPAKVQSLTDAITKLNERLTKINTRELPDALDDLKNDQYKANQPLKTPGGEKGPDDGAKDFGSKFLGGIAQSLGFPDVFGGKAPWDFGAVKMLGRFATGFFNGMQQQQGQGGSAAGGFGGGGGAGGLLDGLAGGFGLPKGLGGNQFQGGTPRFGANAPNVAPPSAGSNQHLTPGGGSPGPGNQPAGYTHFGDNNINVQSAGDAQIASSVKALSDRSDYAATVSSSPPSMDMHPMGG